MAKARVVDEVRPDSVVVETRFQDVQTEPVPVQSSVQGKVKKPKRDKSGDQERGIV
jgi:hypothetical protein